MQTTIRLATAADAKEIAHIHVTSWRTTYRSILPEELLAGLSVERRAAFWKQVLAVTERPELTLVAERPAKGIVGFVDAGPVRGHLPGYDAELYAIYLLTVHQRAGLGRALVHAVATKLLARGHQSLLLWVFAENESRHFYLALGGQVVGTAHEEFGGVLKEKVAYGWRDLAALAEQTKAPSLLAV